MAQSDQQLSEPVATDTTPAFNLSRVPSKPARENFEEFARPGKRPRLELPPPMTAAAAAADLRVRPRSPLAPVDTRISPNPATQAISSLMGVSQAAISNAYTSTTPSLSTQDPAKIMSEGIALAAQHMNPPNTAASISNNESNTLTSPTSVSSFDTQESIAALSGGATTTVSPTQTDTPLLQPDQNNSSKAMTPEDSTRAFQFSTPLLQTQTSDPRRHMSMPHSGLRQNTRSPSSKKHKCPYCGTEFTRHHNLKSHLLTHSQEKPYLCSTCQSRFRRLHDLKRHTKLHTGERPHVCPKCKRKFARGDALARHNKGPGGCAGRRASMGSFGGDDDCEGGDDTMDGVMYGEPESMEDGDGSELRGTPSIRRQAPSGDDIDDQEGYSRIPSTYPPIQGRPPGGIASGHFPSRQNYGPIGGLNTSNVSSRSLHPSSTSSNLRPGNSPSNFAGSLLTESPKPISPIQPQQHQRGPGSLDGRMQSPNVPQFPPPPGYSRNMSISGSSAPQLPPPHGLNPPDPRYTLASQGAPTHPPTQPIGPPNNMSGSGPLSSHSNSLSSHGQSGPSSGEPNSMFNKDERIWAYVKDLEKRMNSMQDEIITLKSQLAAALAPQRPV